MTATPKPPAPATLRPGDPGVLWTLAGYINARDPKLCHLPRKDLLRAITFGCARLTRFGGQTDPHRPPLSVAEHALAVAAEVDRLGLPRPARAVALLHDAAEGLLGFDISAPLKWMPEFEAAVEVEDRMQAAIWRAFGLEDAVATYGRLVSALDKIALGTEAANLLAVPSPWPDTHWPHPDCAPAFEPLHADQAADLFLDAALSLGLGQ